jgi:peptidoglycan/LPS O-acetylase OafA/YrhL
MTVSFAPAPPADSAPSSAGRLHHVDALRAVAALLVLWMHVSEIYYQLSPATLRSRWLYDGALEINFGRLGVVLFFAISGFVVPFSLRRGSPAPVRDFLLRRVLRIAPLYWLSIPLGAYACHIIWGRSFPPSVMLLDMTLLQEWFGWPAPMGLYWTLALEMLFYLCCAALLYLRRIDDYVWIAIVATGLIAVHVASLALHHRGDFTTIPYLKSLWYFHLGIMFWGTLYRAWTDGRLRDPFSRTCTWAIAFFLLLAYPIYCRFVIALPLNYYAAYPLAIAVFVLGTTIAKIRWRPLVWAGEVSYSIYLMHPIVFNLLLWLLQRAGPDSWWRTRHLGFYLVLNALVTLAVAALTYRWIEKPAIALGRRLSSRWFPAARQPLPSAS